MGTADARAGLGLEAPEQEGRILGISRCGENTLVPGGGRVQM